MYCSILYKFTNKFIKNASEFLSQKNLNFIVNLNKI